MRRYSVALSALLSLLVSSSRGFAQDEINLAVVGTASQSTTGFGGEPSRGIDGNTDGNWGGGSITHTDNGDPAPYWQVDLGETFVLSRIVLWNRTDCCGERMQNFRVSILDAEGQEVEGEDYFTDLVEFPSPSFEIILPEETEGQIVRYDILGPNQAGQLFASLAEVQVFGDASDLPPVILRQPTSLRVEVGSRVELSVEASGGGELSYRWQKNGDDVDGATGAAYVIEAVEFEDAGSYGVVVSNEAGMVTSDLARLEVTGFNLARGAPAVQSTTGFNGEASRAVDGNTSGVYGNNSVTHTAVGDATPWWEVILTSDETTVEEIVVWNRTDACCATRLTNFRVSLLDVDRQEIWSEDFFIDGFGFPDTTLEGFAVEVGGEVGKIVRVERLGTPEEFPDQFFLSLAEVEVFGEGETPPPPPEPRNFAAREGAVVSQSSTLGGFAPELAVDGNLGNFTHTLAGDTPSWWQVDLGELRDIATINLHNRDNCCASRLRDVTVLILDADGAEVYASELLNPENELGGMVEQIGPEVLTIDLVAETGDVVQGQIVRVERVADDDLSGSGGIGNDDEAHVLSLGEVEIYGVVECPEEGDTDCEGVTVEGPEDGGPGQYTISATASDESGDLPEYTFTIVNSLIPDFTPIVIGPQSSGTIIRTLGVGKWQISVRADDDPLCDDESANAVCEEEIEVNGDEDNLAVGKPATQSSTAFGGEASRAVDGIRDGVYNNGSITHTDPNDAAPWWEVDLLGSFEIETITLWNRLDCCSERLTNFRVSVLDDEGSEIYGEDFFTDFTFPDTSVEGFVVEVGGEEGSRLRISMPLGGVLSLAEVEVSGDDDGVIVDPDPVFHRGDADDNGGLQLTDAIYVLNFLFTGGETPTCMDAADADDNGVVQLTDGIRILNFLFTGGPPPVEPGPPTEPCGADPSGDDDGLGCETYESCEEA